MKPVAIVLIVIVSLFALLIILMLVINHFISKIFSKRNEPNLHFKFLSLKDYPNLTMKDAYVSSVYKVKLHGGIFSYKKEKYHGVIIFYHGFLSGYINYLNVIDYFAKAGFIVVAFDMYGNYTSEGKSMKGFPVADKDNKQIINFVKNNPELNKYPLFTLGHSWGGHTALTSLIHEDLAIKKACALSPFNSNTDVTYSTNKNLRLIGPLIYLINLFKFGHESTYSAVSALKYTTADVLIISGDQDSNIKPEYSYHKYQKAIKDNQLDNVTIKYYPNRKHFLYLSERSEAYFTKEISFPRTDPIDFDHLDYSLVNELDEKILQEIVDFFLR
ncbi:MAG: lysophospholipase [Bacilli bacterium]|nr:lysophospholipase [Bacilli bacterium]